MPCGLDWSPIISSMGWPMARPFGRPDILIPLALAQTRFHENERCRKPSGKEELVAACCDAKPRGVVTSTGGPQTDRGATSRQPGPCPSRHARHDSRTQREGVTDPAGPPPPASPPLLSLTPPVA